MPNPRIEKLETKKFAWKDLPEVTTPVEEITLHALEQRAIEWIFEAEAGVRVAVKKASELNTLPEYKTAKNIDGDLAYAKDTEAIYAWKAETEEWRAISLADWINPRTKKSELPEAKVLGRIGYVTEVNKFYYDTGTEWKVVPASQFRGFFKKVSELPAEALNEDGDFAYVEETERYYAWSASKKEWIKRTRTVNATKKSTLPTETHNVQGDVGWAEEEKRLYIWNATAKEWQLQELEGEAIFFSDSNLTLENPKEKEKENQDTTLIRVAASEKQFLVWVGLSINKGEAKVKILQNGVAVKFTGAVTELTIKEGEKKFFKTEPNIEVKNEDEITVEVAKETAGSKNLNATLNIEHQVKVKVK